MYKSVKIGSAYITLVELFFRPAFFRKAKDVSRRNSQCPRFLKNDSFFINSSITGWMLRFFMNIKSHHQRPLQWMNGKVDDKIFFKRKNSYIFYNYNFYTVRFFLICKSFIKSFLLLCHKKFYKFIQSKKY